MGIAFAAALTGIYIPAHRANRVLFHAPAHHDGHSVDPNRCHARILAAQPHHGENGIGGFADPVFFTATGMIGMIALGGIVIRNAIVLIEFIQDAFKRGLPFEEAILQSGAIRMRPISTHRRHHGVGCLAHHPGPHLLRIGLDPDLRTFGLHSVHPGCDSSNLLCLVSENIRQRSLSADRKTIGRIEILRNAILLRSEKFKLEIC
jgi:hypothetical protein